MPTNELEILSRVLSIVAGMAAVGWALFAILFKVNTAAARNFCVANLLVVLGDVAAQFRGAQVSLLDYYQHFNLSVATILGCVFLFRTGMQQLQGSACHVRRDGALTALGVGVAALLASMLDFPSPGVSSVFLGCGVLSLLGFAEGLRRMRKNFTWAMSISLMWPFAAVGLIFMVRTIAEGVATLHKIELSDAEKLRETTLALWAQFLIFLLINASLIAQTLNGLIKKLEDQADRLQNILDTAPVGVAVSTDGIIRFANPRVTELLDMKVGDAAANALVVPQDRERIVSEIKTHGTVRDMELQMYCPHHTVRDLLVTYMPTDFEGEPGTLAWMIDITERKKAESVIREAIDEQTAIFESATVGIAFIKDSIVVRANHKLDEMFGWEPGEIPGKSPQIWLGPDVLPGEGPYADIKLNGVHSSTQELMRKDGSRIWCRLSGSAIDANDLSRGTVWMMDDVTAERKAAQTMRAAKELAEDATRMKSDFLANMSHEIRTPMNAIIGMSHLALQTDLNTRQRNYIEKVDAAARSLLGIINDILDFSKIEAGKMRFEATDFHLEDVLDTLADLSVIKAQEKGLELLFDVGHDVPMGLIGDPLRLGQVLLNLVGNAVKFTEHGEVTVGVHTVTDVVAVKPGEVCLRFDISDTGVGLSAEQADKLFNAFAQADASTTRKYGGTGLGLTISKRLVELMDGHIGVHSREGEGSTFYFTAFFGTQTEQRLRPALEEDVTELRILVVDDNARAREIMLAILASQKFSATAVRSGEEAIGALEEAQQTGRPYGLVLMDWMMPGVDGLATIQRIRADPVLHSVPAFVMVTAHSRDELLEQSEGTKIDGLLLKPVGPSALLDGILSALGKEVVTRGRKQQRQEANREAERKVRGAHLLLVEDNAVNQELALEILQAAGIRVDVANNGLEAVEMVGRGDYDGVLMDCQMPVMDGFAATRKIRTDARFADLPILAMTANAMSGDREACLAAGMNDHIGKPIDVNQLFTSLGRWVTPKNPLPVHADGSQGAKGPDPSQLPDIEGLDLPQAMRRMGGNAKLMRKLIGRFSETQTDTVRRIRAALGVNDLETATREAHTTKGLAGNIGATEVVGLAATLEGALKHGQTQQLPAALDALDQGLTLLLAQIAASMGAPVQAEAAAVGALAVDRAALDADMQKLALLLADDDARAGSVAESIAEPLRSLGQGVLTNQLQKLIGKYEFEEALDKLREAASALNVTL